jgi:dsDNA-specific endonuclease/ATPase MutS2
MSDEPIPIPITDTFDLHTIAPRDVKAALEAYLEEAHRMGLTALRIIHGRGIGVQREMVRTVLERTECVVSFGDAPAEAGGWGATIVTLRPRGWGNRRESLDGRTAK